MVVQPFFAFVRCRRRRIDSSGPRGDQLPKRQVWVFPLLRRSGSKLQAVVLVAGLIEALLEFGQSTEMSLNLLNPDWRQIIFLIAPQRWAEVSNVLQFPDKEDALAETATAKLELKNHLVCVAVRHCSPCWLESQIRWLPAAGVAPMVLDQAWGNGRDPSSSGLRAHFAGRGHQLAVISAEAVVALHRQRKRLELVPPHLLIEGHSYGSELHPAQKLMDGLAL